MTLRNYFLEWTFCQKNTTNIYRRETPETWNSHPLKIKMVCTIKILQLYVNYLTSQNIQETFIHSVFYSNNVNRCLAFLCLKSSLAVVFITPLFEESLFIWLFSQILKNYLVFRYNFINNSENITGRMSNAHHPVSTEPLMPSEKCLELNVINSNVQ